MLSVRRDMRALRYCALTALSTHAAGRLRSPLDHEETPARLWE
jgi:hypothetical protein